MKQVAVRDLIPHNNPLLEVEVEGELKRLYLTEISLAAGAHWGNEKVNTLVLSHGRGSTEPLTYVQVALDDLVNVVE